MTEQTMVPSASPAFERASERTARGGTRPSRAPRPGVEAALTGAMLAVTVAAVALFCREMGRLAADPAAAGSRWELGRLGLFVGVVFVLVWGNVVYQLSRLGYFLRLRRHRPADYDGLVRGLDPDGAPPLTVLVPSYKEDLRTVRQTLLSAALQDYPNRRVVLLLDDPPHPADREDAARLAAARWLPGELSALLAGPADRARRAAEAFAARAARGPLDARREVRLLLDAYAEVDAWFAAQAAAVTPADHTDAHFVALTFGAPRALLAQTARRLLGALGTGAADPADLARDYRRLVDLFRVEIESFERKRYANLSRESNKAANLNSYLGLLGRRVRAVPRPDGLHLEPVAPSDLRDGDLAVPDAAYVLTLDADSLLAPDYARRLVAVMERPGNERLAVAQTPYTAIPGAPGALERVAGATTDLQYLVHQGFTWCGATFWVGANALLRKAALDEIRTEEVERGHRVARFVQDRTVIEDTESTVDLVARGWRLFNYPERLAFSATPPDFGALLIQRRRWANGGLLILPKLLRYAVARPFRWGKPLEVFVRAHYLASICASSLGLLALLALPLEEGFGSPWLPLTAAPYFLLYWRDLVQAGYRRGDILRVYAFNLLLLPVNLAGVAKSLQQAATGEKIPFGRTPKVEGRTAAPAWAVAAEWGLLGACLYAAGWDAAAGRWGHALFTLGTAAMLAYALVAFVGLRASAQDLRAGLAALGRRGAPRPALPPAGRVAVPPRRLALPGSALAGLAVFSIVLAPSLPGPLPAPDPGAVPEAVGRVWATIARPLDLGGGEAVARSEAEPWAGAEAAAGSEPTAVAVGAVPEAARPAPADAPVVPPRQEEWVRRAEAATVGEVGTAGPRAAGGGAAARPAAATGADRPEAADDRAPSGASPRTPPASDAEPAAPEAVRAERGRPEPDRAEPDRAAPERPSRPERDGTGGAVRSGRGEASPRSDRVGAAPDRTGPPSDAGAPAEVAAPATDRPASADPPAAPLANVPNEAPGQGAVSGGGAPPAVAPLAPGAGHSVPADPGPPAGGPGADPGSPSSPPASADPGPAAEPGAPADAQSGGRRTERGS